MQGWRFILTQLPVRSLSDTMTSGYILETDTMSIFTVYACVENSYAVLSMFSGVELLFQ